MTDRLNDLTNTLKILIDACDTIKGTTSELTPDDLNCILGPLGDSIADCEYLIKIEHDNMPRDRHSHMGGAA